MLAHDVARLEERTCEQVGLRRSLGILWDAAHPPGRDAAQHDLRLSAELRAAQIRVLRLGRVQAALLGRAQRWLRMVSNLLAGPEASYAPLTCSRVAQYPAWAPASSDPGDNTRTRQEEEHEPMSSLNASLATALSGLNAEQGALEATTNNVANINTPGYSRQVANLVSSDPIVVDPLTLGTGVTLKSVDSIRDPILESRIQQETQAQGQLGALVSALDQTQVNFAMWQRGHWHRHH